MVWALCKKYCIIWKNLKFEKSDLDKELDVISCGNISKFYHYVNNKLGSHRTVQPINTCINNNELTHNPLEQANLFNKYFSSVFTVNNASKPVIQPHTVDNIRCDSVIFNVDNERKALSSLKLSLLRPWRCAQRPAEETCLLSL